MQHVPKLTRLRHRHDVRSNRSTHCKEAAEDIDDNVTDLFYFLDTDGDDFITAKDILNSLMPIGIYPGEEELKTTLTTLKSGEYNLE